MLGINHIRAYVFKHSSAALTINKPRLAQHIIAIKQSKLGYNEYIYKTDASTMRDKTIKYKNALIKCNNQINANALISKIESEPLTKDNANKALSVLLRKLEANNKFCSTDGVFRIPPNQNLFDTTSLVKVIKDTDKLIEKNSDNNHLIASKIKKEILDVTIDADVSETLLTLWCKYDSTGEIPGDEALPYSLKEFIKFLKSSIITNQKDNQMGPDALATVLGMIVTKNLDKNPTELLELSKKVAPMYKELLIS